MKPISVPKWLTVLVGVAGSLLGLATNIYSDAFRSTITHSGKDISAVLLPLMASIVGSVSAILIYRWLLIRRREQFEIIPGEIPILADALTRDSDELDLVAGRRLYFLESKRQSDDLLIFLHGLGLDANDFRPYMAESRFHCIALTLYGFNADEKKDDYYKPISLQSHVLLVGYALAKIQARYPDKRITLVGFSFGADIIFLLARYAQERVRTLKVRKALLLDPNINETTTTISSRIAVVNDAQPLVELVKILESANNEREFRNLCEYLYKITSKDFLQVQRHAREVIPLYDGSSYDQFLDRMGQLSSIVEGMRVILSFDYEQHFNHIAHGANRRGLDAGLILDCTPCGHFELIGPNFLKETLEGILATNPGA